MKKETTALLEKDYKYSTELLKKDYQSIIDRQNDKIELMKSDLDKLTNEKQELQSKLDQAYIQIKEMATRTVEANGSVKILGNNGKSNIE